eukprot:Nitzschia sp. Nitz4//scaffold35_size145790//141461//143401//NITZ4_003062-RA/size145790-processed-gene-0.220-mRNA-1//1//CDS//3329549220//8227//frame0
MSHRAGKGTCPNCGSTHIEQHDASGASVCTECGVVLEENAIVSAVEFVEGAGGASSMVGQFVSATSSKAYSSQGGGRGGYGFSRDSRETTLANGRRRITEVASRLRLGGRYIDAAHRLFTIAVEKNFVQGRRTTHVVAACLYISCRQEKSQHMLIDFSDALQVNVYTLGTCFLKFRRLLGLKLEIIDPALYVYRFAAHLDLDDKANAVALTSLRLVARMKRDWIVTGRRPAGICAAALLIAARAHGFSRRPQDVTRILRVCGMTVATRVREFEHTPTATLTLDQFQRVELETEVDPPIYTKNRIMEARARAIHENNVALLASGALDNPLDSDKRADKWRDGKVLKREEELEELYRSIENKILAEQETNALAASQDQTNLDGVEHGEETTDDTVVVTQESVINAVAGLSDTQATQGEEEDQDMENAVVDHTNQALVVAPTPLSQKPASLELSKSVTIANDRLMEIPQNWMKAYPKGRHGKAIVLADQSTLEERQPPSIPSEGKLDTKTWKETMPMELESEFDCIFRDPVEIAQKEAIFNKINKDYIELQASKDKIRATTEEAETQNDRELVEQTQGHERYRKRKNRGRDTAETTEEALLQAVANRKISRKINYDAMSAIFDDAGNFSTSEAAVAPSGPDEEAQLALF